MKSLKLLYFSPATIQSIRATNGLRRWRNTRAKPCGASGIWTRWPSPKKRDVVATRVPYWEVKHNRGCNQEARYLSNHTRRMTGIMRKKTTVVGVSYIYGG